MILLVGAGLLVRTLERLQSIDLGFDGQQVVTMGISLPGAKYADRKSIARSSGMRCSRGLSTNRGLCRSRCRAPRRCLAALAPGS